MSEIWMEYLTLGLNVLLIIFAGIGLRQLKISKDSIRLSSKREAFNISSEKCRSFYKEGIKLNIIVADKIKELDDKDSKLISKFVDSIKIVNDEIVFDSVDIKKLRKLTFDFMIEIIDYIDYMESLSLFFISGVASEELAYSSIGRRFCVISENALALSYVFEPGNKDKKYLSSNLKKLYKLWKKRLEKENISKEIDEIRVEHKKTINMLQDSKDNIEDNKISHIGDE